MSTTDPKRVLIIGGGYAGIRTALNLAKQRIPGLQVSLISSKPHFEYYPSLYRVVAGYSALQVCVPLEEIFAGSGVMLIEDFVSRIDLEQQLVYSGIESPYTYDYLVLALGAQTSYFNIPGLAELSYGFKSIPEALRLRQHLHDMLKAVDPAAPPENKVIAAHFIIVGGGPTGTEIAGELMAYGKKIAQQQHGNPSLVTVDLIEAAPRLLPAMPEDISQNVQQRLHSLGVNIFTSRTVTKEEVDLLTMKDATVKTKTVIWTAGVKTNSLISQIAGLELDKRGRIEIDKYLKAKGQSNVFALGDNASTQYSGMAQTADYDGKYVAQVIGETIKGIRKHTPYVPHRPIYTIPVGPDWAAVLWGKIRIYGRLAFMLRRVADLRYFVTILPLSKAFAAFSNHSVVSEECPICKEA